MTVVKYATESVANLSGKKKTRLKVRDRGQEEGEVSDKSTKSSTRNKTRELSHVPLKREECGIDILILA